MVVVEPFDCPPPTHNARHCCLLLPFCFGDKMLLAESNHVLMVILVVGESLSGSQRLCLEIEQAPELGPTRRIPNGYVTREEGVSEVVACWCRKASVRAAIPAAHAWLSAVVLCTSLLKAKLLKRRVTWVPRAI